MFLEYYYQCEAVSYKHLDVYKRQGCGETGHIRRNCPKQSYRPPISRGRGGHGRGRYSGGRGGRCNGGHQNGRGDGKTGTTTSQQGRGNGQTNERAHCYAFPGRSEAETSDAVITSNLLVCDCMASVLFLSLIHL